MRSAARMRLTIGLILLAAAPGRAADGYKTIARQFSRAARQERVARVAILPFVPTDGSGANEGWTISERLITRLVRAGGVQTIEREMLRKLLEEHALASTGLIDTTQLKRLGKILSVEAIVTGTFHAEGKRVALDARLIDIETGVILAAGEEVVDRTWERAAGASTPADDGPPRSLPGSRDAPPAPILEGNEIAGRELAGSPDCRGSAERVDNLQRSVLDLKARYWALQLRKGYSWTNLEQIPGGMIADEDLRWLFYDLINRHYAGGAITPLSEADAQLFMSVDEKAYLLHRACALYAMK